MPAVNILVIEDDPIYAESLEMIIEQLGYKLTGIVDNPADAIASVKSDAPDLVLMDIEINSSMSGVELAARLKTICNAPVIYVTSHTDKETFQKAKLTSPEAYIIKPYTKESLEVAIELALMRIDRFEQPVKEPAGSNEGFYIKDSGSLYKINPLEILYIEADEKYCTIVTKQKKHTINIRIIQMKQPQNYPFYPPFSNVPRIHSLCDNCKNRDSFHSSLRMLLLIY